MTKIFYLILIFVLMASTAMAQDCVLNQGSTAGMIQNGQGIFIQTNREIPLTFERHMVQQEKQNFSRATKQDWKDGVVGSVMITNLSKKGVVETVYFYVKQSDVRCK